MPELRTPCSKFEILELCTEHIFVAAVGMLRKKKSPFETEQFQNNQSICDFYKIIIPVQKK